MITNKVHNRLLTIIYAAAILSICTYLTQCTSKTDFEYTESDKNVKENILDNSLTMGVDSSVSNDEKRFYYFQIYDKARTPSVETTSVIRFNDYLHENFNYIELIKQPVEYVGKYELLMDFVNGYIETKGELDLSNQEVSIDGKSAIITPLSSIQIDFKGYEHFELDVITGQNFSADDFLYSDLLPVILGNNYVSYYRINDVFDFFHLGRKTKAKVIGFLPKEQNIEYYENLSLDNYIVIPIWNNINPDDLSNSGYLYANKEGLSVEEKFINIYSLQKNYGFILTDSIHEYEQTLKAIEAISKEYGLDYSLYSYY